MTTSRRDDSSSCKTESSSNQQESTFLKWIKKWNCVNVWATVGPAVGLIGYALQFTGLRNMNWLASVVQLGAVLIMTAARAWVRRGLAQPLVDEQLTPDFELDWLAKTVGCMEYDANGESWLPFLQKKPRQKISFPAEMWPKSSISTILEGKDMECPVNSWHFFPGSQRNHERLAPSDDPSESREQTTLIVRRELGKLCASRGKYYEIAIRLAMTIEAVMEILFTTELKNETTLT